jgi:hypothetical protein
MLQFVPAPGAYVIKLFMAVIYKFSYLSLASLSSLAYCLWVRLEPIQGKHLSGALFYPALPTNIRLR